MSKILMTGRHAQAICSARSSPMGTAAPWPCRGAACRSLASGARCQLAGRRRAGYAVAGASVASLPPPVPGGLVNLPIKAMTASM
jgi:hypothetical protein